MFLKALSSTWCQFAFLRKSSFTRLRFYSHQITQTAAPQRAVPVIFTHFGVPRSLLYLDSIESSDCINQNPSKHADLTAATTPCAQITARGAFICVLSAASGDISTSHLGIVHAPEGINIATPIWETLMLQMQMSNETGLCAVKWLLM